jgi:hypothetical protein
VSNLLTMRLKDREKDILSFTSRITAIPTSKMLHPFVSEAVKLNLGAAILFHIDRSSNFQRKKFEKFISRIWSGEDHETGDPTVGAEGISPRIVTDFYWMFMEVKGTERLTQAMGDIEIATDLSFLDTNFLRGLCILLGDAYISKGYSMTKFETDPARRLFFAIMLGHYYRTNARGTARALTTKWYGYQDLVGKIVDDMCNRYELRYPTKVVEAIEVREAIPIVQRVPVKRRQNPSAESVKN